MPGNARKKSEASSYAHALVSSHFPRKKIVVNELGGGLTNHVFDVKAGNRELVIRISEQREKINYFHKEQWCVSKAKENGIPVPEILEVGNDIIPLPYMILVKLSGEIATHHPARLDILSEAGKYARMIHQMPTQGYGHLFDWSHNSLSKKQSWPEYLQNEFHALERIGILRKHDMLPPGSAGRVLKALNKINKWKDRPCLQHGDLRLKNMMVNKQGKIEAIIDWEESISAVGPYWDLSIALHDLSVDAQQRFLEGYGMKDKELVVNAYALKFFNLLNYAPVVQDLHRDRKRNRNVIEHYRTRLLGALDLFSI